MGKLFKLISLAVIFSGLAVTADAAPFAYLLQSSPATGGTVARHSLIVIDVATGQFAASVDLGPGEAGDMVISPDGARLYVAAAGATTIAVVDLASNQVIGRFGQVSNFGATLAISPDGTRLYAVDSSTLRVFGTASGQVLQSMQLGTANPYSLSVTTDNTRAYFLDGGGVPFRFKLARLDTGTVETVVENPPNQPMPAAAVTPSGDRIFVNTGSTVLVLDSSHNTVGTIPGAAFNMAMAPDGTRVYLEKTEAGIGYVAAVDTASLAEVSRQNMHGTLLTISPDGSTLLGIGLGGTSSTVSLDVYTPGTRRVAHHTYTVPFRNSIPSIAMGAVPRSPAGVVDQPAEGSTVQQPFTLGGWALESPANPNDPASSNISAVHVWAYPSPGSGQAPIFVGAASPQSRPDVAAVFGFGSASGYTLQVNGLPPGRYQFVIFAQSARDGSFTPYVRTFTIAPITAQIAGVIDSIANGATTTQPLVVSGWAFDGLATTGTGVDAVHVWAWPTSGAAPTFLPAAYGHQRGDLAVFGSRFTASGFTALADGLASGEYVIVAYAHSSRTGAFGAQFSVRVTLSGAAEPGAVWSGAGRSPFTLEGYAMDRRAASGNGIDEVHIWAYPSSGGPPSFLGKATPSALRPELQPLFEERFAASGWTLGGLSLAPGSYTIVAFGHSTVDGTFINVRTVTVTIAP